VRIALSMKGVPQEMIGPYPPQRGQIKALPEEETTNAPMRKGVPASDFDDGGRSWHIQILSMMFLFRGSMLPRLQRPVTPVQIWGREPGQSGRPMDAIIPHRTAVPRGDASREDGREGHNLDSVTMLRATTLRAELPSHLGVLLAPRLAPTLAGQQRRGPAAAGGPFVVIEVRMPNDCGHLPDGYPSCMRRGDAGLTPEITLGFVVYLKNNGLHGIKQAGQLKILYSISIQKLCYSFINTTLSFQLSICKKKTSTQCNNLMSNMIITPRPWIL
jgi:hypothetical protein